MFYFWNSRIIGNKKLYLNFCSKINRKDKYEDEEEKIVGRQEIRNEAKNYSHTLAILPYLFMA